MPRWTQPHKAPTVIKKYGNRRLYDTDSSQYVTLEELSAKVKNGTDVRVIDAKTNEDLTQTTLTQIILESRGAAHLLPIPLLLQLIRMDDHALAEFFGRYVSWALEIYGRAKQGAEAVAPYNPFATAPFSAVNALARWLSHPPPTPYEAAPGFETPYEAPPPPPPGAQNEEGEVADLRREVEELKRLVKSAKR